MSMPFYASAEQVMRDRSELARKGIARGRSVVVLAYDDGVLFVAENPSSMLRKVAEIYDRIGFAAVGRYSEYESLRVAGVRMADVKGYSYDRRDVTARSLANGYAQTLNAIFTESNKPFEVEVCVAEVGASSEEDQLYRLAFDGSIFDEPGYVAMGGQAEQIGSRLRDSYRPGLTLAEAVPIALRALSAVGGEGGQPRQIPASQLEVAVLDRTRAKRKFKRIVGSELAALLPDAGAPTPAPAAEATPETPDEPESTDGSGPSDSSA